MTKKDEANELLAKAARDALVKDGIDAFILGDDESTTDLVDFVGTGCDILDLAISNRPRGGIPCGRITELNGLDGTGKSLICAHMIANVQKEGGVACLIDSETAVNAEFFEAVGVNLKEMLYFDPPTLEDAFMTIEKIIEYLKKKELLDKKKVLIVLDSLTGFPTKREFEAGYEREGYGTDKPQILSRAFPKLISMMGKHKIALVLTCQLRANLEAARTFGADKYITPGGFALKHYPSVRIRFAKAGTIKKDENAVGISVTARIDKNRVGPPLRKVGFDIYFDRGIDNETSTLKFLKDKEIATYTGQNGKYKDLAGNEHKFITHRFREFLNQNPTVAEEIYKRMCEVMILSYKTTEISTEDGATVEVGAEE